MHTAARFAGVVGQLGAVTHERPGASFFQSESCSGVGGCA